MPRQYELNGENGTQILSLRDLVGCDGPDFADEEIVIISNLAPGEGQVFGGGAVPEFSVRRLS